MIELINEPSDESNLPTLEASVKTFPIGWGDTQTIFPVNTPMSGWQHISTAPKDGTRILCYIPGDGVVTVEWEYGEWCLAPDGGTEFNYEFKNKPTYWQPLPKPPESV